MITTNHLPSFKSILPFAITLAVIGWLGMILVILVSLPTLGPRWLLFFFMVFAFTGTSLPAIYFLNIRFPSRSPVGFPGVLRQACWVGIYAGIIAWLQLGRVSTTTLGVILAAGLILVEWFIRFQEKNKWLASKRERSHPVDEEDDEYEEE